MKKRLMSCLCLLCTAVLLLTSCTAGLPGSELFLTVKSSVKEFAATIRNLLGDNTPIVIDGRSDYTVIYSVLESDTVKSAVTDFCAATEKTTGLALPTNTTLGVKKKILIGNTGEEASSTVKERLNAATFYIGFQGEDLVVQATNDLMLISALSYLETVYLTGKSANAGDGYFYLPQDLDYVCETLSCNATDYTVIRADNSGDRFITPVTSFLEEIKNSTGMRLSIDNDFLEIENIESAKEILIGSPKRAESTEVLADLAYNEYYIGVSGNKIMILAHNARLLAAAVEEFLATFVTASDALKDTTSKTLALPTYLVRRYEEPMHLLAQNGNTPAVLVYDDELSDSIAQTAIKELAARFKALTDCELPVFSDKERPTNNDGAFEILVGSTNRRESRLALAKLGVGQWSVGIFENTLCVATYGENSTRLALNRLQSILTDYAISFANDSIYANEELGDYTIRSGEKRVLAYPAALSIFETGLPDVAAPLTLTPLREGSYLLRKSEATLLQYNDYLTSLGQASYAQQSIAENDAMCTAVYYNDTEIVTVQYVKEEQLLRITVDPRSVSAIPAKSGASLTGRTDVAPFYAQLSDVYRSANFGMAHVARLCDGSFIVINGGAMNATQAENLFGFLSQNNPLSGNPVIACWILTDGAPSSVGTFLQFFNTFGGRVSLNSVLYSFPDSAFTVSADNGGNNVNRYQNLFRQTVGYSIPCYKARTGVKYRFAGCEIEILLTLEDHASVKATETSNYYNASLTFRLSLSEFGGNNKQSVMVLGNLSPKSTALLLDRYGDYLKSDAVQVPASGFWGGSAALYEAIAAPVVFWGCRAEQFNSTSFSLVTRQMLTQDYAKVCYASSKGDVILSLSQLSEGVQNGIAFYTGLSAEAASGL